METITFDNLLNFYNNDFDYRQYETLFTTTFCQLNAKQFNERFVRPNNKSKLRYLMKSYLLFQDPLIVKVDLLESDINKDVNRFKKSSIGRSYQTALYHADPSQASSYNPSSSSQSQSQPPAVITTCACDQCLLATCPQKKRIADLEEELAKYQAQTNTVFLLTLLALFFKKKNVSSRTAASTLLFLKENIPACGSLPTRGKSWFAQISHVLPTIVKKQVNHFIATAKHFFISSDGTVFSSNSKVMAVLLYNENSDHILIGFDTMCEGDTGLEIYNSIKRILAEHYDLVLRKCKGILSDRAKNQLNANKRLAADAKELGNPDTIALPCIMHTTSNSEIYASKIILDKDMEKFLKTFTRIFGPGGFKYTQQSVYLFFQLFCRNLNLIITFEVEKGKRFTILSRNARTLLIHWDVIKKFVKNCLKSPAHSENDSLRVVSKYLNNESNTKSQLYLFVSSFVYLINPTWKSFSLPLPYIHARTLIGNIKYELQKLKTATSPLVQLTHIAGRVFDRVEFSTADQDLARLFVRHFDEMADDERPLYEQRMRSLAARLIVKYEADTTNFTNVSLSAEDLVMDVPLSNQQIESSFGVLKNQTTGYKLTNLYNRTQFQFNNTQEWLLDQDNKEAIIMEANRQKVTNKTGLCSNDLIDCLRFSNTYNIPDSDDESETNSTLSRSSSISSINSDMSIE